MDGLPVIGQCSRLLTVLNRFYDGVPDRAPLAVELLDGASVPEPYRSLLVHQRDMTSTLAKYHGEAMHLRVLERTIGPSELDRHIVLETAESRRPVEYGAIRIHLRNLEAPLREEVIACRDPLGAILNRHGVFYGSCPGGFFQVRSGDLINKLFRLDRPWTLYGRCNCLSNGRGADIAEVVEILPPEDET
jgi:hypothetical protein